MAQRELTSEYLKMYQKGGTLYRLFQIINDDPDLSFEIRKDDTVKIYFNKKKILTITKNQKGLKFEPLTNGYFNDEKVRPSWVDTFNDSSWNNKKSIQNYLNKAKKYAYKESIKAEFQLQQSISLGNRSFDGRFLVVDMEWQFSQKGKIKSIKKTRPDLVIVDLLPNQEDKHDIYLAEVKLGTNALSGKSGLEDHVKSTLEIVDSEDACDALVNDVSSLIKQKHLLGILKGNRPELSLANKPKMMFILGYRGDDQKCEIEKQMSKLDTKGLEGTVVMYYDTLIQIHPDSLCRI